MVRNVAILRLLFDLALRVSEVVTLDLADLELDRHAVWVSGKGRAEKELLSLPETTLQAINAWLQMRGSQPGALFPTLGPRHTRRRPRGRLTTRAVHRIVSTLGDQAGAKVWPHGLRHSAITAAVEAAQEAGISLDEVAAFSRDRGLRVRDVQGQLASWWRTPWRCSDRASSSSRSG